MVQYAFYFVFRESQTSIHGKISVHVVIGYIRAAVQIKAGQKKISVILQAVQDTFYILFSPVRFYMVETAAVENKVKTAGNRRIFQH